MRKLYAKLLPVLLLLLPTLIQAQTITWNFGASPGFSDKPATPLIPGITIPTLRSGNSFGTSTLLSSSTASNNPGASGNGNAGVAANTGSFSATGSAYFEFTLTPSAGQFISISRIDFGARATGTGPKNYDIRTSLDGFGSAVFTGSIPTTSTWVSNTTSGSAITVTGALAQAITIRIYGYNGTGTAGSGTVNWKIDDLSATVAVTNTVALPTITVTGTPSAFTTAQGTASAGQSVTVDGADLSGNILAKGPAGYEVSNDGGAAYADSVTLTSSGGTVSGATIFVRLKALAGVGTDNGNLNFSTPGNNNPASVALTGTVTTADPIRVVINQLYGGGGNNGSVYQNDFIELYNNSAFPVSLQGWSVQYASAAGASWSITPLTATIPKNGFLLIREAAGAGSAAALPPADDSGSVAMSATSGKVVLSHSTVAVTTANPVDGANGSVVDKVGYGSDATGSEVAPAPGLDNATAVARKIDGADNDNNSTDFKLMTPNPRNSTYTTLPPTITSLNPPTGRNDLPVNYVPFALFSKPIVKGAGNITITANGAPTTIDINDPGIVVSNNKLTITNQALTGNVNYQVGIDAGALKDVYDNLFTGLTPANWAFRTYDNTVSVTPDYTNDFETCTGAGLLPGGFTQFSVIGDQVWDCTPFGRDPNAPAAADAHGAAVQVNGYFNNANLVNEDWLISPKFDLTDPSGTKYALLSFWSRTNFTGSQLQLKVSTDYTGTGSPAAAHWTDLNGRFPGTGSNVWTQSSNINLADYKQDGVYIAFVYTSTTDDGSRWSIDDVKLAFSNTPPPPTLTLSSTNIESGYAAAGITVDKKLTVLGNDLTSDIKVTVTSGANFQVSADSVNFSNAITIGHDTANNKTEPIFVRFSPNINNTQFSDLLTVYIGPDATLDTSITVNVKGNSISPASTLSVVDWNLNWFATPEAGFGPPDKTLQKANVKTILASLHADLFVLEEVVDKSALADIVATMPGYDYVINSYGSHANTFDPTHYDISTSQKLAFVFNTTKITNIQTDSLLNNFPVNTALDVNTQYYNNWAGGRYPYMLSADVVLDDNNGGSTTKRVHFINIHAKANTGDLLAAYNSRKAGAFSLDSLVRAGYPSTDNFVILGDFNDDLNQTIASGVGTTVSSYSPFTIDHAADYIFPTQILSQQGQHSDVNFTGSVIDNVVVNKSMSSWYLPSSATVLSDVANLVPKYGTTTTDHYPIFSQFSFTPPVALPVTLLSFTAVRQDAAGKLSWTTTKESNSASFEIERSGDNKTFTAIGSVAAQGTSTTTTNYGFIDAQPLAGSNYYRLKQTDLDGRSTYSKTVVLNFGSITLRISPNPVHNTANLFVGGSNEAFSIRIVNLNGQTVKQFLTTPGTANIPIDVSSLAKGVYTVKVISATAMTTQKLLVQ